MLLSAIIRQALNLDDDATEEQAVAAIKKLKNGMAKAENNQQHPSLDKYVPRSDYNSVLERATNAEQALEANSKDQLDKEIDAEIESALKVGKITPATTDYHKAQCQQDGGLERFREYVKAAPDLGGETNLDDKHPGRSKGKALNEAEQHIAEVFGNSAEDLEKYAS